jgi:pimeloyl-ACP methyl ester carboxylesterase
MRWLRLLFRPLQMISPNRAAVIAERLFFTVPRARLTPGMRHEIERARPFSVRVENRRVAGWSWGEGPVVYLVHGWGSRGGRLAAYVPSLLAAGYQVVTYDGVGHGASEGRMSSMPELARTLRAVVAATGPAHGIVAHSLGASAATLAMDWGLSIPRAVFIAPAADPVGFTRRWAQLIGLRDDVLARMKASSERRLRFSWDDLDVRLMAGRRRTPLLVVHDAGDPVVPWSDGAAIADAWPHSRLVTTTGLGHSEVVRAPVVIAQVVEYLAGQPVSRVAPVPDRREEREVERELFFRDERALRAVFSA